MKATFFANFFYSFARAYEIGDWFAHFPDIAFKRFHKISVASGDGLTLELGCGTGRSSRIFKNKDIRVVNVDINKAFVAYGKAKGRFDLPLVGSAYDLCFRSGTFDKVIIPDAFHHMLEHESVFRECCRVLKAGGEFIIFDIVFKKNGPNKIINHLLDGPIWALDQAGFQKKINLLAEQNNFTVRDYSARKEKTIMGLIGGVDILARLIKNST